MAGQIALKTFKGGMNKDIDVSLLPEDVYIDAQNYKLIADEGSNSYILENAEGNALWFDLSGTLDNTYYLVGHTFLKPYLILFYTTNHANTAPTAGTSVILKVTVGTGEIQDITTIYTDGVDSTYLTLSDIYPIKAVANYESEDNIKVYWTDGYNSVRMANIMDENLSTYTAGMLDIVPDFPYATSVQPRPSLASTLITGNMKACSVQYAYQYYIDKGVQTLFSPASKIQVIPRNATYNLLTKYEGGELNEDTGYGVKVSIAIPSENLYDHVRVVAIQYNVYNATPQIRVISEEPIDTATSYTLTVRDTGQIVDELLYEQFSVINNVNYKAKDIAIKNNRLFLANIQEELFDLTFDARAYRHDGAGEANIYHSDLSDYDVVEKDGHEDYTFAQVPDDHDCINLYNSPDYETSKVYKYQATDPTTLGAEGSNILIDVVSKSRTLDNIGVSATGYDNTTVSGTSSTINQAGEKSFHRQEVYRLGILFRNEKMQTSPVKWMCDFRMPSYDEGGGLGYRTVYSAVDIVSGQTITTAIMMGLQVTMSNFPSSYAKTWEIVMVPRESDDRGVLAQGVWQPTISYSEGSYYGPEIHLEGEDPDSSATYDDVTMFYSPEISFNKNLEYKAGDFIQKVGYFDFDAENEADLTGSYETYSAKLIFLTSDDGEYDSDWKLDIDQALIITYDPESESRYPLDTYTITPYNQDAGNTDKGISTTFLALDHSDSPETEFIDGSTSDAVPVVNYRRDVFSSQYGGLTYEDRQRNSYISISDPKGTDGDTSTYEGDTFIDFFWHLKQCQDLELTGADQTNAYTMLFPVESSISPRLSYSDYIYKHASSARHYLMQEIAGTHEGDIDGDTYILEQELPLYLYNTIYSQSQQSNLFPADSVVFDRYSKFPTRILNSDQKTNNETLDSFTQFSVNNFIDLNGKYGGINNIEVFKNQLFYWQNTGFGIASVNTRTLISDDNPGALVLGTGGILDRYDYLSEDIGNTNKFGIVITRTSIYWVDNNKQEFFKYDGSLKSVSKIKGIQTWLHDTGTVGNVVGVYDQKYNDVIFSLSFARTMTVKSLTVADNVDEWNTPSPTGGLLADGTKYMCILPGSYESSYYNSILVPELNYIFYDSGEWESQRSPIGDVNATFYFTLINENAVSPYKVYSIVYNEIVDKFVSFASFKPLRWIETDTDYFSIFDGHDLYRHNDDDATRSTYYTTTYDSDFTTTFNKEFPYTKTWDTLKWVSESVDSDDINQFEDTFETITFYNDYQTTGNRFLYYQGGSEPVLRPTETTRRERTWSMSIPRNILDTNVSSNPDITDSYNWDETLLFRDRIRDKYMTIECTYDNESGNTFSIPFIAAIYRKSVR